MRLVLGWDNAGLAPEGWGSHVILLWQQFEPTRGSYRFDLVDQALAVRERPCYLQIAFSMYDKTLRVPVDYTPIHAKRSIALAVAGKLGHVPDYGQAWCDAYARAVAALAERYREHPQVAGYWHAAGWGQETQAAMNNGGGTWADALKGLLPEETYISAIRTTTRAAMAAWGARPVYLPGAPSPGSVWGHRRREVIEELLLEGAGYMNCGLQTDNETAFGVGERAGLGMMDIALGVQHVGFEEGPRRAPRESLEVYWWLMRSLAWDADFVNLYGSISAPDAMGMSALLPKMGTRWIVFRDREYPEQAYTSGGKTYGFGGEPGLWSFGLLPENSVRPVFNAASYGFDRWTLDTLQLRLRVLEWPGGRAAVTCWYADGTQEELVCDVLDGSLTLPGGRYHRVDVAQYEEPLTLEERVERIEKWIERHEQGL